MYQVGDKVVHPMHGAGVIDSIVQRKVSGHVQEFYLLKLSVGNMVVMVPTDNRARSGVRPVVSGTRADLQIRCNQIWAVSLPFSVLPAEKERQVVEVVFSKLYTPYGLRTLDPADQEFHPFYGAPSWSGIWPTIRGRSGSFRWAPITGRI